MAAADKPKVIFEDDHVLAVNKPAGWLTHDEKGRRSVLAWAQDREKSANRDPDQLLLVHRLDKDTSGVLLMVRGKKNAARVTQAFQDRKVLKMYVALTTPCPHVRWCRSELRLQPQRIQGGEKMLVVEQGGKPAVCEIEVLGRGRRLGFVRVIPEQGRKHQIRAALAEMAAPIVGDYLYGGRRVARMAPRTLLHARSLELKHPATGEHLAVRAPVPKDIREAIEFDGGKVPSRLDIRHR